MIPPLGKTEAHIRYYFKGYTMSKFILFCIALLTSLGITLACTASWAAEPQADVKAAYTAWDAAFKKADAKAIAAFYADDALLLPANHEVIRGPAAVETFFAGILGKGTTAHKLELIDARGDGKLLYGAAKWSVMGKDSDGKDQPGSGVATHVFQRQPDGKLKIKLHTFN